MNGIDPEIGDIVGYVMDNGYIRPAIVVEVHTPNMVSLQVFSSPYDYDEPNVRIRSNVDRDQGGSPLNGTWHWLRST